ncbi:methyltransferase domain-containing protein [Flavobacterium sp. RSP29]|uniref:class I SAM-dependent methyltransferase n=1 Tax=Flavobacterium sp. RSP29 TaxID=3401731 RepID=UPI003AAE3363
MIKNVSTGERLEFYEFSDVTVEHLHRYAIANDFVVNKKVLDIASGEGYGSYLLSKLADSVIGVDIDSVSVENAYKKYKSPNLTFLVGKADNIPIKSNSIDIVVSFETIEHHDKHEEMFMEIKRVLKNDGILIMSSPDKKFYSDEPNFKNKFHVKELYFEEFKSLTQKHFKNSFFYFQKAYNLNSYLSENDFFENMVVYSGSNDNIFKSKNDPLYNLVIASDVKTNKIQPSIFNGVSISNLITKSIIDRNTKLYKDSTSYKIGNIICTPFFYLKKLFFLIKNKL